MKPEDKLTGDRLQADAEVRYEDMKKIAILGSTGSIGTQTLEVVQNKQRY